MIKLSTTLSSRVTNRGGNFDKLNQLNQLWDERCSKEDADAVAIE
jgi:hypothetical protein